LSNQADRHTRIEREHGGVKLFVGRLPREVTKQMLHECFEEFGDVVEVFVIASQAQSGVGCAFVRMGTLEQAEAAMAELHEQRILIPEQRDLGPMQVAFAKGEAIRLGIDEKEEILPSYREARQKVVEHNEKRQFFADMQKQQEIQQQVAVHQQAMAEQTQMMVQQVSTLATPELISIIKDGQRFGGPPFKQKWWAYCDQGWAGSRDYDPSRHPHEILVQFVTMTVFEFGHEPWVRKHFDDLPELPPLPAMPPMGLPVPGGPPQPGQPPFGPPGLPGAPPMMPPPPFGPPGLIPGGPAGMMPPPMPGMPGFPSGRGPMSALPGMVPGMPGFPFGAPGFGGESKSGAPHTEQGKHRRVSGTDQVSMLAESRGAIVPSRDAASAPKGVDDDSNSAALSAESGSEAGNIDDINADDI